MNRILVLSLCSVVFVCSHSCLAAERIVFARLGPSEASLFISNADGSAERPLTPPGSLDYNPSWSHKGDWIVFTSERADGRSLSCSSGRDRHRTPD